MTYDEISIDPSIDTAEGRSGLVKFGTHHSSNLKVAVKFLTKKRDEDLARFRQENEILFNLLKHENVILPYSRVLSSNGLDPHYIMEKADESLLDWISRYPTDEDIPKKIEMLSIICGAVRSIQAEGYIHRDLHEKNIFIAYEKKEPVPKIMDFGRSYNQHEPLNESEDTAPSWGYYLMPPEIEFGLVDHDDQAYLLGDAYAIGYLIKMALGYQAASNIGHLLDIKERIIAFKKSKNGGSAKSYIKHRDFDARKRDYIEWCKKNSEWSEKSLVVELDEQEKSEAITKLVRDLSNINHLERQPDLNIAIKMLKRFII